MATGCRHHWPLVAILLEVSHNVESTACDVTTLNVTALNYVSFVVANFRCQHLHCNCWCFLIAINSLTIFNST